MVIGTLHRVDPQVVAHLQVAAYLLACEAHYVELVLVFVELEHIAHADRACLYGGVELQRSIEGNVGMGNLQLQIEDEVVEGAASEVGVAAVDGVLECANLLAYILVYLGYLWFEIFSIFSSTGQSVTSAIFPPHSCSAGCEVSCHATGVRLWLP